MKNKLFALTIALFSVFTFAQTKANAEAQNIKKSLLYFVNSIKFKKIDQAVNCIYPKFFTVISKEQMTSVLNLTYNNPFVKIDVQELKYGGIEKAELINGEYYSIVNYYLKLHCNVIKMEESMRKKVGEAMVMKYGKANVKYLDKEGAYLVNTGMKVCAVSKDNKSWKFVMLEKEYKDKLKNVLPEKVLNKI